MSTLINYINLNKKEKTIFIKQILDFLQSFCQSPNDFSIFLHDILQTQNSSSTIDNHQVHVHVPINDEKKVIKRKKVMEVEKVEKVDMLNYDDLSPNVIIYNILPYHLLRGGEIKHEFDCFGMFKKDRLRNIWYLFNSLYICYNEGLADYYEGWVKVPFYFNDKRLKYFECDDFFGKYPDISFDFRNLERIYMNIGQKNIGKFDEVFKKNKFSKLDSIKIEVLLEYIGSINLARYDSYVPNYNLKGIKKFDVNFEYNLIITDTSSLKHLVLSGVSLNECEKWGCLSNVEVLTINNHINCEKIFNFHKFEKLKKLKLFRISESGDLEMFKNFRVKWDLLEIMKIERCSVSDTFFQLNIFNSLKEISLFSVKSITGKKWKEFSNIKSVNIRNCEKLEGDIFAKIDFRNVEKITCINCCKIDQIIFDKILKYQKMNTVCKSLPKLKNMVISHHNKILKAFIVLYCRLKHADIKTFEKLKYIKTDKFSIMNGELCIQGSNIESMIEISDKIFQETLNYLMEPQKQTER